MKLTYLYDTDLPKALAIAVEAHEGQKRMDGQDYIVHPLRVMGAVEKIDEKIVAVLHDVPEDTDVTLDDLRKAGFKIQIIEAVDAITKRKGEKYQDYLARVMPNELALEVKIADIHDNLRDQSGIDPEDAEYFRAKYHKALHFFGSHD
jgi:(p)ppGpp synthase/HD superfamily hydrolase